MSKKTKKSKAKKGKTSTENTVPVEPMPQDDQDNQPETAPEVDADGADLQAGWLARIRTAQARVEACESEVNEAKENLKAAKGGLSAAQKHLREEIQEPTNRLPFSDTPKPEGQDAWRSATLEDLGFDGRIGKALADAELTTLGAIADYTAADKRLTDIAGIGPAAAEQIEAAMDQYWKDHPPAVIDDGGENGGEATPGELEEVAAS